MAAPNFGRAGRDRWGTFLFVSAFVLAALLLALAIDGLKHSLLSIPAAGREGTTETRPTETPSTAIKNGRIADVDEGDASKGASPQSEAARLNPSEGNVGPAPAARPAASAGPGESASRAPVKENGANSAPSGGPSASGAGRPPQSGTPSEAHRASAAGESSAPRRTEDAAKGRAADAAGGREAAYPAWLSGDRFRLSHRVQPGETWFSLARTYYGSDRFARYLMERNGRADGPALRAGETVQIPNPAMFWHTVAAGETLAAISKRYFGTVAYAPDIARANGLANPAALSAGATLLLRPPKLLVHVVRPGETYAALSRRYFGSERYAGALRAAQGAGNETLRAGDVLMVPLDGELLPAFDRTSRPDVFLGEIGVPLPLRLVVKREAKVLFVYEGDRLVKTFPIAVGRLGEETPAGVYRIVTKLEHPYYRAKNIPGGDPRNPLGSHWLGLNVPGTDGSIYGLHGTNDPSSIGHNASSGCIRLYNDDVRWLYEHLPLGTEVEIK
ncbi:MAG: L,D-transpeptidase family protein [Hydrogenibacillus schlegelii]|uniref:L,D-transpeptidase family protein n=1 Tax=Hydrogenibacillus schlegelii TaxID=1484 RepID=A0A947GD05_HYDSH|nr:L,D-transpeptidase family protein [Hydrogenibacillus schlegelii]